MGRYRGITSLILKFLGFLFSLMWGLVARKKWERKEVWIIE